MIKCLKICLFIFVLILYLNFSVPEQMFLISA